MPKNHGRNRTESMTKTQQAIFVPKDLKKKNGWLENYLESTQANTFLGSCFNKYIIYSRNV